MRRACYSADRTGHMILQTLFQQCVARSVNFFNEFQVLDIVFDATGADRRVAACVAYELATGDLHVFQTKAVLFATGGFGKMFKVTSNAHTLTGDGPGLLYRRGIPMEDMEFFQFHPTGIYKLGILLSEAARGEGGILRNSDGERFMERYAPTIKDLAPRDMVCRADPDRDPRGPGHRAEQGLRHLDLTHLPPEQIDAKLPDITEFVRTYLGLEPKTEPIPIQPTAHYAMGGIPTNIDGEVVVDAANTCFPASTPPASARASRCTAPTGSAPTHCSTSSCSAGGAGGRWPSSSQGADARARGRRAPRTTSRPHRAAARRRRGGEKIADIRTTLQDEMMDKASVFRTEESLLRDARRPSRPEGALRAGRDRRQGRDVQLRPHRGARARLPARPGRGLVVSGRARTESRGAPLPRRPPDARRRQLAEAHARPARATTDRSASTTSRWSPGRYKPMERKY